jgi:hypothetical protein
MTMTTTAAGTTMTRTAAGTMMTRTVASTTMIATAIAEHDFYLYLPVCTTIAPKKNQRQRLFPLLYTSRKASTSLPETGPRCELVLSIDSLSPG